MKITKHYCYINQSIQAGWKLSEIETALDTATGDHRAELNRRWSEWNSHRQDLIEHAIRAVGIKTVEFALGVHEQR